MSTLDVASLQPLFGLAPSAPAITAVLASLAPSSSTGTASPLAPDVKAYPDATYHNHYALGLSLCFTGTPLALSSVDVFNAPPTPAAAPAPPAPTPAPPRPPPPPARAPKPTYAAPPALLLRFASAEVILPARKGEPEVRLPRAPELRLGSGTTGREAVRALGEPQRKGAGGWVGVWLEWAGVELLAQDGSGGGGGSAEGGDEMDGGVGGAGGAGGAGEAGGAGARQGRTTTVGLMLELADPGAAEAVSDDAKKRGLGGVWERAAGWAWASAKVFAV